DDGREEKGSARPGHGWPKGTAKGREPDRAPRATSTPRRPGGDDGPTGDDGARTWVGAGRGPVEGRSRAGRGPVEGRSRSGRGPVEVRSRAAVGGRSGAGGGPFVDRWSGAERPSLTASM